MQRAPAVAQALEDAGPVVLDQDVRGVEQAVEDHLILGATQVQGDRLLPVVQRGEVQALPADERADGAGVVAVRRLLHLDDPRAELGEDERAVGAREDAGQVDDDDAVERRPPGVAHARCPRTAGALRARMPR